MKYECRSMLPEEQQFITKYCKLNKVVSDFHYVWTRWHAWEENPPVVVVTEGIVVGFHGYKFTKSGYMNSVAQWVHPDHQGKRLAGEMVKFMLCDAYTRNMKRMRLRCLKNPDDGNVFWTGFGLVHCGETEKEWWYDFDIEDIQTIEDLMEFAPELCDVITTDKRTLSHYKRSGVWYTHPAWKHLNIECV